MTKFEDDAPNPVLRARGGGSGIRSMIGVVAGMGLGWYCGASIFVPLVGMAAAGAVLRKTVKRPEKTPYIPALTIQAGYLFWLALGTVAGASIPGSADIAVLLAGMVWLLVRPGRLPAAVLCLYQLAGMGINIHTFASIGFGDPAHRALIVHLIIRTAAVIYLAAGYLKAEKAGRPGPAA